jgi:hypothetical protein
VIHRDDQVEVVAQRAEEKRIGRKRPLDAPAARATHGDRRNDLRLLLAAPEQSAFAGMRIDAADRDPRVAESGAHEQVASALDRALDETSVDFLDRIEQADVRRHVDHAQLRRKQHQRHFGRSGQVREQLGVSRVTMPGCVQRFLVERRGADRVDVPLADEPHGTLDVAIRGFARDGRELAERKTGRHEREIEAVDRAMLEPRVVGFCNARTGIPTFAIWAARSRRFASPITSGRPDSYGARCASAFITTSGPTPAGSPIVIPMRARFMTLPFLA